jgi:hypothetical protein
VFNADKSEFRSGSPPKTKTLTFANGTTTVEGVNVQGQSLIFANHSLGVIGAGATRRH